MKRERSECALKSTALGVWDKLNQDNDLLQTFGLARQKSFTERSADAIKMNPLITGAAEMMGYPTLQHKYQVGSPMFTPDLIWGQGKYNRTIANDSIRREGSQLNQPDIMREFVKALPAKIQQSAPGAAPEQKAGAINEILNLIKTNFSESFRQASAQMQSAGELEQIKQQMMASMQINQQQADGIIKHLQNAATVGQNGPVEFMNSLMGISNQLGSTRDLFASIQTNAGTVGENLGKILTPANDAGTNLGTLATATGNAVGPMNQLLGAANNTLSAMNTFNGALSNIQINVPNITVSGGQVISTGGGGGAIVSRGSGRSNAPARQSPFSMFQSPASVLFPSKASGGRVRKDGFIEIHKGEDIVPASVTKRYEEPRGLNQLFALARNADAKPKGESIRPFVHRGMDADQPPRKIGQEANNITSTGRFSSLDVASIINAQTNNATPVSGESINFNLSMPVTIKGSGSQLTTADVKQQLMAEFSNLLDQHMLQIEYSLAGSFDRGRERK